MNDPIRVGAGRLRAVSARGFNRRGLTAPAGSVLLLLLLLLLLWSEATWAGATHGRRTLLRLTFDRTLRSEQGSACTFRRPSPATTFDAQGFLVDVGPDVPRYRTVEGQTGIVIEGPRINFCTNSSFERGLQGWDTAGLTASRIPDARLHGGFGLRLVNPEQKPAAATFRATPLASQGQTALSVYLIGITGTDPASGSIRLLHNGEPLDTALYPAPRPGWHRAVARMSCSGKEESFGIQLAPGAAVFLDAVQLEHTHADFDFAETSFIPTSGKPVERAPETLTHPTAGFVDPHTGTVTIDYFKQSPYPAGELWWVGRGDGQDGLRACEGGNYYWQIYINGEKSIGGAKAEKKLWGAPGIHRFQGSWDEKSHLAQVWMDGELADSQNHADMPQSVSPQMYLGANGRWGYSLLHFNGVLLELSIQNGRAGNEYLLMGDVIPEFARDSPQSFAHFDGILFNRIFGEFWSDIEQPRTPASIARPYIVATLTAVQKALASKGVWRNFIRAANFGSFQGRPGWEGGYGFPINWFNDTEWEFIFANVAKAADVARRAGFAGFAIDVEYSSDLFSHPFFEHPDTPQRHDNRSRADREKEAFLRGRQLAQRILKAWPTGQLLFIPFETEYGDLYRQFFVGFVEGARLGKGAWVGLMNEYGYHADTRATAVGTYRTQNGRLEDWIRAIGGAETLAYWREHGEHLNAAWPLGQNTANDKQRAHRSPDRFARQLRLFQEVNPTTTVIYEEMAAWWQMTDAQARAYGLQLNTGLYQRHTAPPAPNLAEYAAAIPR